ncbi:MAG: vWA domain-containing protein [Acidimicrobiales bacterium]
MTLLVLLGDLGPAAAQDELRIARVVRSPSDEAEVLVSVPRALSGRTLGASAFTVTVDGNPVTATVTRANGGGFDIALVIETSSSGTEQQFVATKAAAVEFVLQQPADTRIELVASDPSEVTLGFTTDRATLVAAIKRLSRVPGEGFAAALDLAARSTGVTRPVTIIAAPTAGESTLPATALRDEWAAALRTGPHQLFAVGAVSASLAQLAGDSGGFARVADVRQLVGAFDAVSSDIAGRYALSFAVPARATRFDVRVTAPEGTSTASFALSSGAGKSAGSAGTTPPAADPVVAARSANDSDDSSGALPIALVVGGLLVAGLLGVFFVRRSRRGTQLAFVRAAPASALPPPPPAPLPPALAPPALAPALAPPPLLDLRRAPAPAPLPIVDLRRAATAMPMVGYALTALCDDDEFAELRAAVESCGIVVSQAYTADEALRAVVSGRARALYVDAARDHACELAAAVRQRNDEGWSSCPTLVHDSRRGPLDPALVAVADAFIAVPIDASLVVAALATRG